VAVPHTQVSYEEDFTEWAHSNAELLRTGKLSEADVLHIAEELEDLGIEQHHALKSRITRILEHLLKLNLVTGIIWDRNHRKWSMSVERQRVRIERLFKSSPSLKRDLTPELLEECYRAATRIFHAGFEEITPPAECPYNWEEILG
jgi:DNA-binding Lrp family transcriptional regulator